MLELDERWRGVTTQLEQIRAAQNEAGRALRGAPSPEQREQLAGLAARGRELSEEETRLRGERDAALASLPNLPAEDAPAEDTVLREVGEGLPTGGGPEGFRSPGGCSGGLSEPAPMAPVGMGPEYPGVPTRELFPGARCRCQASSMSM